MKVIVPGKIPAKWHYRVVNICRTCGARYQLEPGDYFNEIDDQRDGNYIISKCPTCKSEVNTSSGAPTVY